MARSDILIQKPVRFYELTKMINNARKILFSINKILHIISEGVRHVCHPPHHLPIYFRISFTSILLENEVIDGLNDGSLTNVYF